MNSEHDETIRFSSVNSAFCAFAAVESTPYSCTRRVLVRLRSLTTDGDGAL